MAAPSVNKDELDKLGKDLAAITEERDVLKAENTELKKLHTELQDQHASLKKQYDESVDANKTVKKSAKPSQAEAKVVQLERYEGGKVVETNTITEATWNNLPKAHKKDWKVKKPNELNS